MGLTVADLDNDGDQDIVSCDKGLEVNVWKNTQGKFTIEFDDL